MGTSQHPHEKWRFPLENLLSMVDCPLRNLMTGGYNGCIYHCKSSPVHFAMYFSVLLRYVNHSSVHPRCSLRSCVIPSPANQVLCNAQSQSWICPLVCRLLFGVIGLERGLGYWMCVPWCQAQASLAWLHPAGQRKKKSAPYFKLKSLIAKFTYLIMPVLKILQLVDVLI